MVADSHMPGDRCVSLALVLLKFGQYLEEEETYKHTVYLAIKI